VIAISPLIGILTDRFGPRRVGLISLCGLSIGLVGLASINANIFSLYAAWIVLALLGGGTTPIVWTRAVNRCFNAQRGVALGLCLAGTGVGAVVAPILLGQMIADYGWRAAYLIMAAAILFVALPLVALLLKEGEPAEAAKIAAPLDGATLKQALATAWFWRSGAAFFLIAGGLAALILHLAPMLMDSGLTAKQAGAIAGLLGVTVIVGRLAVGLLVDRLPGAYVGMGFLVIPAIACLMLLHGAAVPAVLLIGLAAGAEVDLLAYLVSRRFGLRHYGQIYGWQLSAFLLGAGVAPILMGAAHDRFGSYGVALNVDAVVILLGALGVGSLHRGGQRLRQAVAIS
jgi:predicted MFS family arabinose efflux permease